MKIRRFLNNLKSRPIFLVVILGILFYFSTNTYANNIIDKKSSPNINLINKPIVIGIFPRRNRSVSRKIYTPLVNYLESQLNRKVILKTPRTFGIFWENIQDEKYDLVHYNQYHYIASNKAYNYNVILRSKEFGSDKVTGVIVVRKDSGINSIQDLNGKKIVFGGGPKAMQSYIYARYLLEQGNLQSGDYIAEYALNPPNALFSLFYGKTDAAGVGDATLKLHMVTSQIKINELKVISKGKLLPHLPWAVHSSMPTNVKKTITDSLAILHKTPAGNAILKAAKLNQFIITKDSDYNEHRKIIESVLDEDY